MLAFDAEFRAMSRRTNAFRRDLPLAMATVYRDMVIQAIQAQWFREELLGNRPYSERYAAQQTTDEYWRETSILLRNIARNDALVPILSRGAALDWGFTVPGSRRHGNGSVSNSLIAAVLENGSPSTNVTARPLLQMVYDEVYTDYIESLTGRVIDNIRDAFLRTAEGKSLPKYSRDMLYRS
jgi:hypothetical protein